MTYRYYFFPLLGLFMAIQILNNKLSSHCYFITRRQNLCFQRHRNGVPFIFIFLKKIRWINIQCLTTFEQ